MSDLYQNVKGAMKNKQTLRNSSCSHASLLNVGEKKICICVYIWQPNRILTTFTGLYWNNSTVLFLLFEFRSLSQITTASCGQYVCCFGARGVKLGPQMWISPILFSNGVSWGFWGGPKKEKKCEGVKCFDSCFYCLSLCRWGWIQATQPSVHRHSRLANLFCS